MRIGGHGRAWRDGKDIVVHGSATLVQTRMAHDLVDRYRLLVYPVALGHGKRLFKGGIPATLTLLESRAFSSGVVAVVYEPERHHRGHTGEKQRA